MKKNQKTVHKQCENGIWGKIQVFFIFFAKASNTRIYIEERRKWSKYIYFVAICYYYIRAPHKIELSFWCKFNIRDSLIRFRVSLLHLLGNHTKCSHCQNGLEIYVLYVRTISLFSCINTSWWTVNMLLVDFHVHAIPAILFCSY